MINLHDYVDENGRIKLDELSFFFCDEEKQINGYFAQNWIQVFEGDKYLLKTLITDESKNTSKEYDPDKEYQLCELNAVLMPHILKQLGIPSAAYFLATYNGKNIIMSPSFLTEDEELVEGDKILDKKYTESTDVYMIMKKLKHTFNKQLRDQFLIQTFANKFINQTDERNRNWGVITNKKTKETRLAPMFDFDFCGPSDNNFARRFIYDLFTCNLNQFIEEFYYLDSVKEFLGNVINNFDLEAAFKECEEESFVSIPENDKNIYRRLFASMLRTIQVQIEMNEERRR